MHFCCSEAAGLTARIRTSQNEPLWRWSSILGLLSPSLSIVAFPICNHVSWQMALGIHRLTRVGGEQTALWEGNLFHGIQDQTFSLGIFFPTHHASPNRLIGSATHPPYCERQSSGTSHGRSAQAPSPPWAPERGFLWLPPVTHPPGDG